MQGKKKTSQFPSSLQYLLYITITLTKSKVHIAILTNGKHNHYAKITNGFNLPDFKSRRTTSVHLNIRLRVVFISFSSRYSSLSLWVQFLSFNIFYFF